MNASPAFAGRLVCYLLGTAAILTAASLVVQDQQTYPIAFHTTCEAVATTLAFIVGIMALTRHYSRKSNVFLVLGAGFLGAGLLDGTHTILTSLWLADWLPSPLVALAPWSWLSARMLLSSVFLGLWWAWSREQRLGEAGRLSEPLVYLALAGLTGFSLLVFFLVPLPPAYFGTVWSARPQELIPAVLFFTAFVVSLRTGIWEGSRVRFWLETGLWLEFTTQLLMSQSHHPHDAAFIGAHLLKPLGYLCLVVGLCTDLYRTFLQAEASRREASRARESLRQAHVELEYRVQARALELITANNALKMEIDERTRVDLALEQSHRRLQDLIETIDGIVWEADARMFQFTFVSKQAERILGYPAADWLARPSFWENHVHPDDRERALTYGLSQVREGRNHTFEYRMIAADGRHVWLRDHVSVIRTDGAPTQLRGVMVDISAAKGLEAQICQARKMEAIGQFAGGIAHDFNNLLTAILGYSELALAMTPGLDLVSHHLGEIKKAGTLARSLTSKLLTFSRQDVVRLQPINLNQAIESSRSLIRLLLGEHIALDFELTAQACIQADPLQIEQLLVNLAVNARDAMPQGGRLRIATADRDGAAVASDEFPAVPPGRYVRLEVRDTGCGMDAATQARIFEPFFTTKPAGKGTGLGLSNVFSIVQQSGGHIAVRSAPGQGAAFAVCFPSVASPAETGAPPDPAVSAEGGTETILVVDDNPVILELAQRILQGQGYAVLTAESAEEAVQVAGASAAPIDLLLTDVIMPGNNGRALADYVAEAWPDVKLLYMSGYTDDELVHQGVSAGRQDLLAKPFTPQELLARIRERLKAAPARPAPEAVKPQDGSRRILVADDDELVRNFVRQTLESCGHEVLTARSGTEAIASARRDAVDLVVTDILMPDCDGLEVIQGIRRAAPSTKIIAMSGGGQVEAEFYLTLAEKFRVARTLRKPFSRDELLAAVRACQAPAAVTIPS